MKNAPLLAPLQQRLQAHLLAGDADIEALIVADDIADASARLDVYAQAYRLRLLDVLRSDYPVLLARIGAAKFAALGRSYIDAHPSDTPSVRWFGRHLAEHLRIAQPSQRALADLAAFEWSQGEVFDAPDAPVLKLEAMAHIAAEAWGEMRVILHPAVRLLTLASNAPALVSAQIKAKPLPRIKTAAPQTWLLWRRDYLIHWRALGVEECAALEAVRADLGFGDICERLCEWIAPEQVAITAAGMLKRWISDELISELEFN
jgi:hypothetical protein